MVRFVQDLIEAVRHLAGVIGAAILEMVSFLRLVGVTLLVLANTEIVRV